MADLPRILCGPILRRCDENLVTVWLATSFELPANAAVRVQDCSRRTAVDLGATAEKRTVRVGLNLYVHLLLAHAPKGRSFPQGTLLGYELDLGGTDVLDWRNLCYTGRPRPAVQAPEHLKPTFFLQPKGEGIRIMHGSCRKPYGMGLDALAAADAIMSANPFNLRVDVNNERAESRGRPALLYLTGDQIYADDVEEQHFAMIRDLAVMIMGYIEQLPLSDGSFENLYRLTYGAARKRFALRKGPVGFTSEDGEGHLLGLGEFAAMYLMVWSEAVWNRDAVSRLPKEAWKPNVPVAQDHRKAAAKVRDMYWTLPAVQRALANVPTYMIFDDHDVTDDWNLDLDWFRTVSKSVPGRRVVANALAAYWLFQGWGNNPMARSLQSLEGPIAAFCKEQLKTVGSVKASSPISKAYEDKLWDFHDWGFVVNTEPRTVFVDMRTQRELYPRGTGPALLNSKARQNLAAQARRIGNKPLILVSSAPVFNIGALELGQSAQKFFGYDIADLDYEQWSNNPGGKHEFLKTIIQDIEPACCIFLSGEVHFGLTGGVDYYLNPPMKDLVEEDKKTYYANNRCGRVVQLTSSSLKNENEKVSKWLMRKGETDLPGIDAGQRNWRLFGVQTGTYSGAKTVGFFQVLGRPPDSVLWVEQGESIHNKSAAYAPIEGRSNLGVVTIARRSTSVMHEFYVVIDFQPSGARFAPEVAAFPTVISCIRSTTFQL